MNDFRVLIHHHAVAYKNAANEIFLPSFIARWVDALANHFEHIGLLLYESPTLLAQQDEIVQSKNVTLWSLGPPGKTWDRISRIKRLRKVCALAAEQADVLLVRGITPRQLDVWNATPVKYKGFLLVGSLLHTRPTFRPTFWGVYEFLISQWRRVEVIKMAKHGILMANSPLLVSEMAELKLSGTFVPTNSIRIDEFSPFILKHLSTPRKILFCGRVVKEKGIIELLNAVAQLKNNHSIILNIVGPVEPIFRQTCEKYIQSLGIANEVVWHGRIPYGDILFDFYRQSDILVLPSYNEGFPHVLWEAAANCCPIITTNVGGIPAIFKNGRHSLLIPPKNIPSLVEALEKLLSDSYLRQYLVKQAYQLATAYTVDSCAQTLSNTLISRWSL